MTAYVPPAERTHCPQGHPYDEANTRIYKGRRHCRACTKEAGRRYREQNPERLRQLYRESRARRAEKIREYEKSPKELARRAAAKRRLRRDPEWHARELEQRANYRSGLAGKLKNQLNLARWRATQTGAIGADYCSLDKLVARLELYGYACAYCGDDSSHVEIDHRIPLSRGGTGFPANLVPCCRFCNASKNNRTPSEWKRAA